MLIKSILFGLFIQIFFVGGSGEPMKLSVLKSKIYELLIMYLNNFIKYVLRGVVLNSSSRTVLLELSLESDVVSSSLNKKQKNALICNQQ